MNIQNYGTISINQSLVLGFLMSFAKMLVGFVCLLCKLSLTGLSSHLISGQTMSDFCRRALYRLEAAD